MHLVRSSALMLALLAASALPSLAAGPKSDVAAAYAAWDKAFNSQDSKALSAAYLPGAKLLPPTHEVATGPTQIEKFFAGLFPGVSDHKLQLIDAGGDGKIVYGTAKWSAKAKEADGKVKEVGGLASHVFERQGDGSLKLRSHTFN